MIHITYSRDEKALAERIRDDLAHSASWSVPVLIVLVSRASLADRHVQAEIEKGRVERLHIIPILTEAVETARGFDGPAPIEL